MAMQRIDIDYDVSRTPDEVFAYLTDFTQLARWRSLDELRVEPDGPLQPGSMLFTRVKGLGRPMTFTNEVVLVDPQHRTYDDRATGGTFLIESGWTVEPHNSGSRIHWSTRFAPRGPMKMLTPVLRSAIRRGQLADLDKLRNILEHAAH